MAGCLYRIYANAKKLFTNRTRGWCGCWGLSIDLKPGKWPTNVRLPRACTIFIYIFIYYIIYVLYKIHRCFQLNLPEIVGV